MGRFGRLSKSFQSKQTPKIAFAQGKVTAVLKTFKTKEDYWDARVGGYSLGLQCATKEAAMQAGNNYKEKYKKLEKEK